MTEVKTELKVKASSEGFANLRNEAGQLNSSLREGARQVTRGFRDAERTVDDFGEAMRGIERSVGRAMTGITRDIQTLIREMGNLNRQASRAERVMARGGFLQGVFQGVGAGEMVQRGPGMYRQMAGRMAGRAAAGPFRMAGGAAFSGVSGFAQGLASIPGGGLVAAPMMNAVNMAEQAIQFQRAQFQALPQLGGFGLAQRMGAARRGVSPLAGRAAFERALLADVDPSDVEARVGATRFHTTGTDVVAGMAENTMSTNVADIARRKVMEARYRDTVGRDQEDMRRARARATMDIRAERASEARDTALRQARNRASREAKEAFYAPIRRAGKNLGAMDATQASAFAAQLASAGGTTDPRSMVQSAMAAQTAFGVNAETSGAFLRAGRRGGMAGGAGGDAALVQTLREGMALGLEGSELTKWMQEMAEGISRFEQTGIPINPRSVGSMARAISLTGVGATRGQRIAQGLMGAGQRLSQQGPSSAMDIMMLQQAGFQGGGTESLMDAMIALEQGLTGPQATAMMQGLVRAGGGGAGGIFTLQRGLSRLGVNIGLGEAKEMAGALMEGGQSGDEKVQAILSEQKRGSAAAPTTPQGLQKIARTMVDDFGPALKRQAGLTNQALGVGSKLVTSVQDLKTVMTNTADSFATVGAPLLKDLTGLMATMSTSMNELAKAIAKHGVGGALKREMGVPVLGEAKAE